MATVVTEFDAVSIKNASVQFIEAGVQTPGTSFGATGSIEGETESIIIEKKSAGLTTKSVTKPTKMNLTYSGHFPVAVLRKLFGLSNEGLKPGVYSYGQHSKGTNFVLTADVVDEFEDVTKLIAFPNVSNSTGLKIQAIENGAEEVAQVEFEFTALPDAKGQLYYEALEPEIDDQTVVTQWHTQFNPTLVEVVTP
jgi:hypothetical protein